MPRRGENIYKRKDGRWEGRYKIVNDCGVVSYRSVYAATYGEVKTKLANEKATHQHSITKDSTLFSDLSNTWLEGSKVKVKESSYAKYRNIITNHLLPEFSNYAVSDINFEIVDSFIHKSMNKGLSAKSVRDILTVFKSILRYASRCGCKIQAFDILFPRERKKEIRILTISEHSKFVNYLIEDIDYVKFGILLALNTGLRIGELCSLQWKNFSFQDGTINVSDTMQRIQCFDTSVKEKTKVIVRSAKSDASQRTIPLTTKLSVLCDTMKIDNDEAFILTGNTNYMEPRALYHLFKKHTERCDLKNVTFHTLRHTFATRCVEVGFDVKTLSEILGHSSVKVTLDRYVHTTLSLKRSNMEKLSQLGL